MLLLFISCSPTMPHVLGQTQSDGSASCSTAISDRGGTLRYTDDATQVSFQYAPGGRLAQNQELDVQVYTDDVEPQTTLSLESDADGYVTLELAELPQSVQRWGLVIRDRRDYPVLELSLWPLAIDSPGILCAGHVEADRQPLPPQPFADPFQVRAWTWKAEGLSVLFEVLDRDAGLTGVDYDLLARETVPVVDEQASASLTLGTGGPNEVGGLEIGAYAFLLDADGERVGDENLGFKLWME